LKSNSNSKKSTQNLEELQFLDLPQTNRWKHRFYPEDHVSIVGLEFGSFKILGSRIYRQTLRGERERERELESWEKWARETDSNNFNIGKWVVQTRVCVVPLSVKALWTHRSPVWTRIKTGTSWKSHPQAVRTRQETWIFWPTRPETCREFNL
jgi:hypothetical protein